MADEQALDALDALMRARHSSRAFLPDQVPDAVIARIVEVAQRVPSWCNAQPWQLIVTRGEGTEAFRKRMIEAAESGLWGHELDAPKSYDGIYRDRRSDCGWQLYDAVGVKKGDRAGSARQMFENFRLFGAPHTAIVTSDRALGTYGAIDCGAFVTGFTLAAEAAGVGSIPQAAIAGLSAAVRDYFQIPEDRVIVCAISFGYEDKAHPANMFRTSRATPDEVIDWR
ncbi:MAG: nitroreductase [Rhodobacteraceae bacterium]|nr:nitroreductase [Paracoccaceae bacterium]